ncbi:transcriptional regulator, MarR family [Dickeya chrysanthemi Ech1591]|uniref:Transcriptional regulator, MarR family n=1 Tax=Dickeya chrysanthemi (strain Ech1591) TaxID=561229 RepID=C6CIS9_DICC1|nr:MULTISPECIES: MarR family transcriptional regulator [Dickeya]ACT08176.1 transcriptional regulator, MarR family [Dickeya chrysanthemi Ech1591]TYL40789.1 MarR family transcriptional regulator [Dickeya sp. ws52]WJM85233.1 MarR family transcriptional regulator [Dickeya chrysanthemi]
MSQTESSARRHFAIQLGQTTRLWRRVIDRELQPYGLTQASWLPLLFIAREEMPTHQKALAESLGLDASAVVRVLDNLQKQGFIERREGSDRRFREIHLTAVGLEQVKKVESIAGQVRNQALEGVSEPDIQQVSRIIDQVIANLSRSENGLS